MAADLGVVHDAPRSAESTLQRRHCRGRVRARGGDRVIPASRAARPVPAGSNRKPVGSNRKPEAATGKPDTASGKPDTASGKPDMAIGKPDTAIGKPEAAIGKPDMAIGKPGAAIRKPDATTRIRIAASGFGDEPPEIGFDVSGLGDNPPEIRFHPRHARGRRPPGGAGADRGEGPTPSDHAEPGRAATRRARARGCGCRVPGAAPWYGPRTGARTPLRRRCTATGTPARARSDRPSGTARSLPSGCGRGSG